MPNTPSNYYLVNDQTKLNFSEIFEEKASFASINNVNLLFHIYSLIKQKEIPAKLHVSLQEGYHDQGSNKGFSVRHIFYRKHMKPISKYFQKKASPFWEKKHNLQAEKDDTELYMNLIKIINMAFADINNLTPNDLNRAILWCEEKSSFIFIVDTGINFNGFQHLLVNLYLSGKDRLNIITLYLISDNKFKKMKSGFDNRYQNIFGITDINKMVRQYSLSDKTESKDEKNDEEENGNKNNTIEQKIIAKPSKPQTAKTVIKNVKKKKSKEISDEEDIVSYEELVYSGVLALNESVFGKNLEKYLNKMIIFLKEHIEFKKEMYEKIIGGANTVRNIALEMDKIFKEVSTLNFDFQNTRLISDIEIMKMFKRYSRLVNQANVLKENLVDGFNDSSVNLQTKIFQMLYDSSITNNNINESFNQNITNLIKFAKKENFSQLANDLESLFQQWQKLFASHENFKNLLQEAYNNFFKDRDKLAMRFLDVANKFILFALKNSIKDIRPYNSFIEVAVEVSEQKDIMQVAAENTNNLKLLNFFMEKFNLFKIQYSVSYHPFSEADKTMVNRHLKFNH